MRRTTAILSVLTAAGLIVAAPYVLDARERSRTTDRAEPRALDRIHHFPRGFADADHTPPAPPVSWDRDDDKETRPYHLLVELVHFHDLSPHDEVEAHHVEVLGARSVEKVGPGQFLASQIDLALTSVRVASPDSPASVVPGPGHSVPALALRMTVAMARDAITRCSVVVLDEEHLDAPFPNKGVVQDRFTGDPLPGVVVALGERAAVLTDEEGRFQFEEPMEARNLLGLSVVTDGYLPFQANYGLLSRSWLEHCYETGEMLFTLRSEKEHQTYRPIRGIDE